MRTYAEIAKNAPLTTEQVETLCNMVAALGNYTLEYAQVSVEWFVNVLGMGEYYYKTTPLHRMAGHLASIMAAEILGRIRGGESTDVHLVSETEEGAMYIILDDHKTAVDTERRIERRYPRARLQSYRTRGKSGNFHLRIYFVTTPQFDASQNDDLPEIERLGCREFITWSTPAMLEMCNEFFCESTGTFGPYIKTSEKSDSDEVRIMVALHGASNLGFFSAVSDVIDSYGLYSNRKFVEPLADGSWIYIFYISRHLVDDESFAMLRDDISRAYVLPRTELSPLFEQGQLAAQEAVYAYAALTFSNQFLSGYNDEYGRLSGALRENPQLLGVLSTLKTRLVKDTFTEERIRQTISDYPQFVKQLYADFARRHQPGGYAHEPETPVKAPLDPELVRRIRREVQNEVDRSILSFFGMFNRCVLKTNFYKTAKTSLAFRLDPMFLEAVEYPAAPHGIFMVLGGEFRAYHVRFRDVARGGIRIVRSNNLQDYLYNRNFIFEENYNLALTQQYKNKDIPEGGAKGTILLSIRHQDKADLCFKKYIDGLLDLMMPNGEMIDHYGREELLFLGPDEGTADLMEWAALRGRSRGYRFWKSFTTGKPPSLGGIPHDLYGMTTHSVHRYVLGILEKLGIDEASVTKVQTGGPDGDLGGNEIRISKDRTIAIVDGSGVLYDPRGLDRGELERLVQLRQMVEHFNVEQLGPEGFLVRVADIDVVLPGGRVVESGLDFRNHFHLDPLARADLFVPCGGRPRAIHINNVEQLFDEDGTPRFRFVVEGANLFITQEARIYLEQNGVIVFKDASANKGGVTSSSFEVLAGLSLSDDEFDASMTVKNGELPAFRQRFVAEVIERIQENARMEFDCIWRESEKSGAMKSVVTDQLSTKINRVFDAIADSNLPDRPDLRESILSRAFPKSLLEHVGLPTLIERVPTIYLRAVFSAYLASHYVYSSGFDATEVAFIDCLDRYRRSPT